MRTEFQALDEQSCQLNQQWAKIFYGTLAYERESKYSFSETFLALTDICGVFEHSTESFLQALLGSLIPKRLREDTGLQFAYHLLVLLCTDCNI